MEETQVVSMPFNIQGFQYLWISLAFILSSSFRKILPCSFKRNPSHILDSHCVEVYSDFHGFFFFFFFLSLVYLAVLGLRCCIRAFSSCIKGASLQLQCAAFSSCGAQARSTWTSAVRVLMLSCPAAWGIFPDHGWNLCPLHSQVDSKPLDHQGNPRLLLHFDLMRQIKFSSRIRKLS